MSTSLLVAGLMLSLGAVVQGMVGFGLTLVAIPVVAMVSPSCSPARSCWPPRYIRCSACCASAAMWTGMACAGPHSAGFRVRRSAY